MFANEYFTDYSGFILKSPYIYPSGIYDEDKFEYIVKLDHGNGFAVDFYYTENSFPDLKWAMCLDIYVENSKIYGLFEYENSRFVLEINALDDEWKATIPPTTKIPYLDRSSFRYYVMSYVGANNSYRIITREEIEKTRKNLLQNLKDYKIGQQKAELLQKKRLAAEEEEYKRKQLQRKSMLIDKYGEEFGTAISENKVMVGMSEEMCRAAWGTPYDRFNKMTWWGNTSVWVYNYKTYLYFRDGKLKEIYK